LLIRVRYVMEEEAIYFETVDFYVNERDSQTGPRLKKTRLILMTNLHSLQTFT
jgi:hypothetical protein